MTFLASDALNGRGSGTRDEWIAAAYLASQMQQWGLEPLGDNGGFVQQVEIERLETASPPTLVADGKKYVHARDNRVQSLGAARSSGALQKYVAGVPVKPGAALLLPATPPAPATPGAKPTPPVTTGAAIVLTMEGPNPPPAGVRLPARGGRPAGGAAAVGRR